MSRLSVSIKLAVIVGLLCIGILGLVTTTNISRQTDALGTFGHESLTMVTQLGETKIASAESDAEIKLQFIIDLLISVSGDALASYNAEMLDKIIAAVLVDPSVVHVAFNTVDGVELAQGGTVPTDVETERPARFNLTSLAPLLDAAHSRLEGVVFENLGWQDVLTRYDGPNSLFYLDPPYFGGENDYGKGMFDRSQFATMADMLRDIGGAFILSINDTPEIREIFAGFHFDEVRLKYTVSAGAATDASELIISNREIKTTLL